MISTCLGYKCNLNLKLRNFEAGRNLVNLTPHLTHSQSSNHILGKGTGRYMGYLLFLMLAHV